MSNHPVLAIFFKVGFDGNFFTKFMDKIASFKTTNIQQGVDSFVSKNKRYVQPHEFLTLYDLSYTQFRKQP